LTIVYVRNKAHRKLLVSAIKQVLEYFETTGETVFTIRKLADTTNRSFSATKRYVWELVQQKLVEQIPHSRRNEYKYNPELLEKILKELTQAKIREVRSTHLAKYIDRGDVEGIVSNIKRELAEIRKELQHVKKELASLKTRVDKIASKTREPKIPSNLSRLEETVKELDEWSKSMDEWADNIEQRLNEIQSNIRNLVDMYLKILDKLDKK